MLYKRLFTLILFSLQALYFTLSYSTKSDYIQELFKAGNTALYDGDINGAIASYTQLLSEYPALAEAQHNLAYTYKVQGYPAKAIPLYLEIIEKNPKTIESLRGLSCAYLMQGDYVNGWKTHLQLQEPHLNKLQALIQNNEVTNKRVLLIYQGGLGDTFNFIRYAERLKKLGATVIASVQAPLVPLLSRCPFIDQCISKTKYPLSYIASVCDVYAQIMNLPALFEDTETTIPCSVPYIFPDHELIKQWNKITNKTTFNIGICWHPDTKNDQSRMSIAKRDIPVTMFEKLQNIPNVHFYSLQKKDGLDQLNRINAQFPLTVIDDALLDGDHGPFMDTAAIIANLDLVITVDSAIAHLAGALGKQVWLLLPYATDWRWLIHRTDSPWYPTMRIFKQPAPFDWNSVMENVYTELSLVSKNKILVSKK